jgi:Anti-sigma-K factor rskA/Putative zinc-finger
VSGDCPTHGQLVGGYALGALEPAEMEEMRRHVAVCAHCGPEADRLETLPGLLDRIVPADVPPPVLPPRVEEEVLDRFARERRERDAAAGRRRSGRRLGGLVRAPLAAAAVALVALVVALALLVPSGDDGGSSAYANVSLDAAAGGSGWADAKLGNVPEGTWIELEAGDLPAGEEYEVWCVRADGRWVSGGTFWPDPDGRAEAELTAAVRPGDYHRMVVTRRTESGDRGPTVLAGDLKY